MPTLNGLSNRWPGSFTILRPFESHRTNHSRGMFDFGCLLCLFPWTFPLVVEMLCHSGELVAQPFATINMGSASGCDTVSCRSTCALVDVELGSEDLLLENLLLLPTSTLSLRNDITSCGLTRYVDLLEST